MYQGEVNCNSFLVKYGMTKLWIILGKNYQSLLIMNDSMKDHQIHVIKNLKTH